MDGFMKTFIVLLSLLFIGIIIMVIGIVRLAIMDRKEDNIPKFTPTPFQTPLPIPSLWTDDQLSKATNIFNNFFKIFVPNKNIIINSSCFNTFINEFMYVKYSFNDFSILFNNIMNNPNIITDDTIKKIISFLNNFVTLCENDLQWNNVGVSDMDLKNLLPSILDDDSKFNCVKDKITQKYTYLEFSFLMHLLGIYLTLAKSEDDLPSTLKEFANFLQNICN